ncbi:MAG: Hsp70 family protein [Planctomycetaceae bacterium]
MGDWQNLVGIDLGTCYSSIAVLDQGGFARTIKNEQGETSTPSVVYFSEAGPVVGTPAEEAYRTFPERVVYHSKRFLGTPGKTWEIDGVEYSPVDVAATILRKLKRDAEKSIGQIRQVVITVPAHFSSQQRQLTLEAASQAGLDVIEILNEPVAAALCYILGSEGVGFSGLANSQRVLVYDLGGGTFDLSLVDYQTDNIQVLRAKGDLTLGGIDWNQRIIDFVARDIFEKYQVDPRGPKHRRAFAALALAAEHAKRELSRKEHEVAVRCKIKNENHATMIDRDRFEKLTADLLVRTRLLLEKLIRSGPSRTVPGKPGGWQDIDAMLLVGGSSRMPMIRKMVLELAENQKLRQIDPELSVAHGAALYAGLLISKRQTAGEQNSALQRFQSISTQQVSTLTLGMLVRNKVGVRVLHPLIPKDSPLPAAARVSVTTIRDNQRCVKIQIMEVGHAAKMCECVIDDLPENLPEGSRFHVDLTYSPGGILQVVAQHQATGLLSTVSVVPELK